MTTILVSQIAEMPKWGWPNYSKISKTPGGQPSDTLLAARLLLDWIQGLGFRAYLTFYTG